jgi:hypothetical protein
LREKNAHILVKARAYRQQAKGLATTMTADDEDAPAERHEPAVKQKATVVGKKTVVQEPETAKKPRKARAASEESGAAMSDAEPVVVEPKVSRRSQMGGKL